jgi:hypothetical protein
VNPSDALNITSSVASKKQTELMRPAPVARTIKRHWVSGIYLGIIFALSFSSRFLVEIAGFHVRSEYVLVGLGLVALASIGILPIFPPRGRIFCQLGSSWGFYRA